MSKQVPYKIFLDENEMPRYWMNLQSALPNPLSPMLNPGTGKAATRQDLERVFCGDLVDQENYQ